MVIIPCGSWGLGFRFGEGLGLGGWNLGFGT